MVPWGTNFLNKEATIQNLPSHSMPFPFVKQQPFHTAPPTALMKSTSGTFNVYRAIQWKGEAYVLSQMATNQVSNAILTDNTGTIPITLWADQITNVHQGEFCTFRTAPFL